MKSALDALNADLAKRFRSGEPVVALVAERARAVGAMVTQAWSDCLPDAGDLALVAVGGFGRGELHPHSDIDLMILFDGKALDKRQQRGVEAFVMLLWDCGFMLGHSVRNVAQCEEEARADVATATSLMEARLLSGSAELFARMAARLGTDRLWPAREFFHAKLAEQRTRHAQFHETAYNLEPNIKEGPGGLRDIQMIGWVAQRDFGARSLHGLVEHGFLTEQEYVELSAGQQYLWRVRFALHLQAGRAEDRLLFDHQQAIAALLGYTDDAGPNSAVEQFMQGYYRTVTTLERLNERLLQLFEEELLTAGKLREERLGENFLLLNGYLDLADSELFRRRPVAIMEMFLTLARHPDIRGVRASAIRQVVGSLDVVDANFRQDPEVLGCFLELLAQPEGVYTQLQRMNRYGVLAAFLPQFGHIVGRMQFDLFHVYTVDQHILFVIRNLRRFAYGKYRDLFPHAPKVFREIDRPQVLYLAALFHDIAKGRDGDHSELGAADAREFCAPLALEPGEAGLIEWLVRYHLLMSMTAQKKDISDPRVVEEFAQRVGTVRRLQHLYLLTVADISGTSPKLLTSWRSGLLWELYQTTLQILERGGDPVPGLRERVELRLNHAQAHAEAAGLEAGAVTQWLRALPASAFMRFNPTQLQWALAERLAVEGDMPVVGVRDCQDRDVSELFISSPDYTGLFATVTAVLEALQINILSARVVTTDNGFSFDLFQVVDRQGRTLHANDCGLLKKRLTRLLAERTVTAPVERRMPRRLRPFVTAPAVQFGTGRGGSVTSMELTCTDRPGLLSQVAWTLAEEQVRIHDAMIVTLGDRVEDTFLVSDRADQPLDEDARERLKRALLERLRD